MMKKILTGMLSLALLAAMALPALAADRGPLIAPAPDDPPAAAEETAPAGHAVEIDGEDSGIRAHVIVPLRAVAEQLGFTVTWNNGTVLVEGDERYAEITIGVDQYFAAPAQEGVMGASLFSLGFAPYVSGGVTYVPVELFDALLGCKAGAVTLEGGAVKISTEPDSVQIPNPFIDCFTMEEAVKLAGFPLSAPDAVDGSGTRTFRAIEGELLEALYFDGKVITARIRKAPGSGDISGDYNQYAQTKTVDIDGSAVTMKGADGLFLAAVWERGGYTYAITAGAGMSAAAMSALIRSVN